MNPIQYATEILEPHFVPFISSLPGSPEDYQTVEDGLRVHAAKHARSTIKHMAVRACIGRLVLPTLTQSKISGLYLNLACGNDNKIRLNDLCRGGIYSNCSRGVGEDGSGCC
jgi:hypothetical protein